MKVIRVHFWLLFALQEAKFRLKRLRAMLFGEKAEEAKKRHPQAVVAGGGAKGGMGAARQKRVSRLEDNGPAGRSAGGHRPGHGRGALRRIGGAERVECRHEEWGVGERCPRL